MHEREIDSVADSTNGSKTAEAQRLKSRVKITVFVKTVEEDFWICQTQETGRKVIKSGDVDEEDDECGKE